MTTSTLSPQVQELTAQHRCDRCRSAAQVLFHKEGGTTELLFCGHHASSHQTKLAEQGFLPLIDNREFLKNHSDKATASAALGTLVAKPEAGEDPGLAGV